MTSPYWTAEQAAEYLDVHVNSIYRWSALGKLKVGYKGRIPCYRKEWLDGFVMGGKK